MVSSRGFAASEPTPGLVRTAARLPALLLGLGAGHAGVAAHGLFEGCRPLAEEGLDLLAVEVHQGGFHQAFRRQPDLAVADDPAGQDEAVAPLARLAVPGVEVPHPVDHQVPAPRVPHLVEAIHQQESAPFLERPREQISQGNLDFPFVLVIARDEVVERDIPVGQGVGIGGQGEEDGQPPAQSQSLPLPGGESQGQDLEEGGLARAGVPQEDQAAVLLEEAEHRQEVGQALPHVHSLLRARQPAGDGELAGPGLAFRRVQAGLERDVHLQERQLEGDAVRDAHAPEVEVAVGLHQILEIGAGGRFQVRCRRSQPEAAQEVTGLGGRDVDVQPLDRGRVEVPVDVTPTAACLAATPWSAATAEPPCAVRDGGGGDRPSQEHADARDGPPPPPRRRARARVAPGWPAPGFERLRAGQLQQARPPPRSRIGPGRSGPASARREGAIFSAWSAEIVPQLTS